MKKRNTKNLFSNVVIMITTIILLLVISGCGKQQETITTPEEPEEAVISNEEAASIISEELAGDEVAYGIYSVAGDVGYIVSGGDVSDIVDESGINDELENDSTIVFEDDIPPYTYNIRLTYGYTFIKDDRDVEEWDADIDSVKLRYSSTAVYKAPRISGSRNAYTSKLEAYGFQPGTDFFKMKGNYLWDGTNIINRSASDLSINISGRIELNYFKFDKGNMIISEGSADVYISGETGGGKSFQIHASIIFNGDGTAAATINGETFIIDLDSGDVI